MARKKVEICGVNSLYFLKKKKKIYLSGSSKVIFLPENIISKEIYDLFSVSSNDFQEVVKMQMIFFKLAASVL